MIKHDVNDVIQLFNSVFFKQLNTELRSGGNEPIYLPASSDRPHHQIIFTHDYFASAMHEIAHWCIAGPERRLLEDYGYWYEPDGRSVEMQVLFEKAEIKPQAIEWILSVSCGFKFQVSCDNLNNKSEPDRVAFALKVHDQVIKYLTDGMPERAKVLSELFCDFYGIEPLIAVDFLKLIILDRKD